MKEWQGFMFWFLVGVWTALLVLAFVRFGHAQLASQMLVDGPFPTGHRGPQLTLVTSNNPQGAGGNLACPFRTGLLDHVIKDVWANLTGRPLTIRSVHLWMGAEGANSYDLGTTLWRDSDGSPLYFSNWDRYAEPTTQSDREYHFDPGVILNPNDSLTVWTWCVAYARAGSQASILTTIRFVP